METRYPFKRKEDHKKEYIRIPVTLTKTITAKDMDANENIVERLKQWMEIMVHG